MNFNNSKRVASTLLVFALVGAFSVLNAATLDAQAEGLIGDGSTQTSLMQTIIDKAASQGDDLYFPQGRYGINGDINIPSNVRIYGSISGVSQIESSTITKTLTASGKNNIIIENLSFKSVGLDLPNSTKVDILNNIFYDADVSDEDYKYIGGSNARDILIEGNFFFRDDNASPRIMCIYLWRGYELMIRNNVIGGKLSYLAEVDTRVNNRTWMANNFLQFIDDMNYNMSDGQGLYRKGIYINGNTDLQQNNIYVIRNAVIGSGFIASKVNEDDYYDHAMYILTSKGVHIWGNYFTGWPYDARGALKFRQGSDYTIANNYLHDVGVIGYRLSNETWDQKLENWWIYGNQFYTTQAYEDAGMWCSGIMYWDKVGSHVEKNFVFWENDFLHTSKRDRIDLNGTITQSGFYYDKSNTYYDGSPVNVEGGDQPQNITSNHPFPSNFNEFKDIPVLDINCIVHGIGDCGGSGEVVNVTSVSISQTSLSVNVGESSDLNATVLPSNATNKSVTWSSSNTSVATVNSSGLVTGVAEGTATITVKTNDQNKTATCAVTITQGVCNPSTLTPHLKVDSDAWQQTTDVTVDAGQQIWFGPWPQDESWSWTGCDISGSDATIRDPKINPTTSCVAVATYTNSCGAQSTLNFNITVNGSNPVLVTGVSLSQTSLSLEEGQTSDLNETVSPSDADDKSVTWSSSNTGVATVNSSGLVSAVSAGTATITVTTNDQNKTATCAVTVTAQQTGTNIALNKSATQSSNYNSTLVASLAVDGNTSNFSHTQNDANAWWQVDLGSVSSIDQIKVYNRTDCCSERLSNFHVLVSDDAFSSTDLNTTINQSGVRNYYTSGSAGSPTTVDVNRTGRYVRVQLSGTNFMHPAEVEVIGTEGSAPVIVTGVSLSQTSLTLDEGQTSDLDETVSPSNADNKSVTWSSSNTNVATVNSSGLVSAVSAGTATITVTTNDQNKTATCALTVNAITSNDPVVSFANPTANQTFDAPASVYVKVNASDADGSIANVKLYLNGTFVRQEGVSPYEWNASNQNDPALVNMAAGTYTLLAVATDNEGNTGEATINITVESTVVAETYTETFENMSYTGWGSETYTGDNGFNWSVNGKSVTGYIDGSKGLYSSGVTIAQSETLSGGISSFSVKCKNKWNNGEAALIELLVNGNVVGSSNSTSQDVIYYFEVNSINISGDVVLALRIGSKTIAIDDISWTTYAAKSAPGSLTNHQHMVKPDIYPNPFGNIIFIQTNGVQYSHVSVLNLSGQKLLHKSIAGRTDNLQLDLSEYQNSGLLILQLVTIDGAISNHKIVKK